MNTIIHDPTRGWLLLTPDGQIEIAKEDWETVHNLLPMNSFVFADHHPYSVDAEFEVVEQYRLGEGWSWGNLLPSDAVKFNSNTQYRQIARLVKAKEVFPIGTRSDRDWPDDFPHENGMYQNKCCRCNQMFYGHKRRVVCKTCYWNPTDSVTSDGTPLDANQFNGGDRVNHFLVNALKQLTADEIATLGKSLIARGTKPTESQDELWNEVDWLSDYYLNIEEAKKRFRIERI